MTNEIEKINSKYKEAIKKFIEAKIENPRLSVRTFCKAPRESPINRLITFWADILKSWRES